MTAILDERYLSMLISTRSLQANQGLARDKAVLIMNSSRNFTMTFETKHHRHTSEAYRSIPTAYSQVDNAQENKGCRNRRRTLRARST